MEGFAGRRKREARRICRMRMVVRDAAREEEDMKQGARSTPGLTAFLVVFRTNSSYDRWWEARKAWQHVVNACRSHATSVASSLKSDQATEEVRGRATEHGYYLSDTTEAFGKR